MKYATHEAHCASDLRNGQVRDSSWIRALSILAAVSCGIAVAAPRASIPSPHLRTTNGTTQLVVSGEPFLILGGELLNNSGTSLDYLKPVWQQLRQANLNTALVAVSWAQLEPTEGKFDFTIVDGVIEQARENRMKLVLLWFGSWKNTWSSYAPVWVKKDFHRFPRVRLASGAGTERLTPLSEANQRADALAFAALMRRIRQVDAANQTVIMIQVENEVGVIPDARDHSAEADSAYRGQVPKVLVDYLVQHRGTLAPELRFKWQKSGFRSSGSWEEIFGPGRETEDLFMAWHYARYIGAVTAAGKAEYPLPMFVNAALIRTSYLPGQFNSGGPLPHSLDIWRAGGPQIDFLAPDIYFEFKSWADKYTRNGNPLFVPETRGGTLGAADVFYAVGHLRAIGFSPFGIDRTPDPDVELGKSYDVLRQLSPLILRHQVDDGVDGVVLGELTPAQKIQLGGYILNVTRISPRTGTAAATEGPDPNGIFIATAKDEFYMAGSGLNITFTPDSPGEPIVGLATVEEGKFVDGVWLRGRTLAGDDTGQGNSVSLRGSDKGVLRVVLYRYR
ncbi:MAG TPA: DUF5597 domain-containing protein [Steroidobacteraceae bacterium]|nr:DUF5597 domain-containing protein [Steroidobacteraceae bacterium]